jgi:hypothetical protein
MALTADDIQTGEWYRAKRPRKVLDAEREFDDRYILWLSAGKTQVDYDGPAVKRRGFRTISLEVFLKWAGEKIEV